MRHEEPIERADDDVEMGVDGDKPKVECLCPKCDKRHFLSFKVVKRQARTGRNPQTGAEIQINACNALSLCQAKFLKMP